MFGIFLHTKKQQNKLIGIKMKKITINFIIKIQFDKICILYILNTYRYLISLYVIRKKFLLSSIYKFRFINIYK